VLSHLVFLWNALGMPINQMRLILDEGNAITQIYDTLDPVAVQGRPVFYPGGQLGVTLTSCLSYLTNEVFRMLKEGKAKEAMVLHAMRHGEPIKAVLMDHVDLFGRRSKRW